MEDTRIRVIIWMLAFVCLAALCQSCAPDTEVPPETFEQELELLKLEQANWHAWISALKWAAAGLAALVGFWLVDVQREKRAATLQTEQLKRSLFENYVEKGDDDNLVLWERKVGKLEAILSNDMRGFIEREKARIEQLKVTEKERKDAERDRLELSEKLVTAKSEGQESLVQELHEKLDSISSRETEALSKLREAGISVNSSAKRIEMGYAIEPRAALGRANLQGANLGNSELRGALLVRADLREAFLGGADLRHALMDSADLRGAYLRGACLWQTFLFEADPCVEPT